MTWDRARRTVGVSTVPAVRRVEVLRWAEIEKVLVREVREAVEHELRPLLPVRTDDLEYVGEWRKPLVAHLDEGLVIWQQECHSIIVWLIRCRATIRTAAVWAAGAV